MLQEGKIDKASALNNLATAIKKLDSAKYFIDREWEIQNHQNNKKVTKKCSINIALKFVKD